MTTPADSSEPLTVTLTSTTDLIAAVPPLLGFIPTESLVLLFTSCEAVKSGLVAIRADLSLEEHGLTAVEELFDRVRRARPRQVSAVIVSASPSELTSGCAEPAQQLPHRGLADGVRNAAGQLGVELVEVVWTPSINTGAAWCSYLSSRRGVLPDPRSTPLAVAVATSGSVIFANRDELADVIAPDPAEALARRAVLLAEHARTSPRRGVVAVIDEAIDAATHGQLPDTDEDCLGLALALAEPDGFDHALHRCDSRDAEQLWVVLTRALPGQWRADPAILLGVAAFLRGDGALASIALDAAHRAEPRRALPSILLAAIRAGLSPMELRGMIDAAPGGTR